MEKIYLKGRTHDDFCSALYGLLSQSARALEKWCRDPLLSFKARIEEAGLAKVGETDGRE